MASVEHNFTQNSKEEASFAIGHRTGPNVQIPAADFLFALDVQTRLEHGLVGSADQAANRFRH